MRRLIGVMMAGAVMVAAGAAPGEAQSLGTFRWQLQPYCNVVTVQVEQRGAVYTLDGFDDQCGASQRAPLVGLATPNPDGSIGFGLHLVGQAGRGLHIQARITLAALGGTWNDSAGNTGTFAFGASTGGPVRPFTVTGLPPASITGAEVAPGTISTTHVADGGLRALDVLDGPRATYAFGDQSVPVSSPTIVRTATLNAPGPGKILVTASGAMSFGNSASVQEVGWCYFGVNGTRDLSYLIMADDGASPIMSRLVPFSGTFGITVAAAGPVKVDLVCEETFPASAILWILDSGLTLSYFAQ